MTSIFFMINSEIKKLPNSQVEISVSASWDQWEKYLEIAAKEYSKEIKIEGFRPGKAPKDMVEKKVGKGALLEAAAQTALRETYAKVLIEKKIEAIGAPKAELTKLAEGNALEYKIVTDVLPVLTLKPWRKAMEKLIRSILKKRRQ